MAVDTAVKDEKDAKPKKEQKVKKVDPERKALKAKLLKAELRQAVADAREAEHNADVRQAEAEVARIQADQTARELSEVNASDSRHHIYKFSSAVSANSVANCIATLTAWSRITPDIPLTVVFNSPGGDVINGMALFDFFLELRERGHHLTTICRGYAASMAGILLQAGDTRVIGRESYLMIHEISAGTSGKIGEIQDAVKFYEKIGERVIKIFVDRSGGKITKANFVKGWLRTDWWLTSDEALKAGFVDEIR